MPPSRPLPPPPIPGTPVQYFPSTTVLIRRNLIGACTTDPTTHEKLCTYHHTWHHYFGIGLLTGTFLTLFLVLSTYLIYRHRHSILRKLGWTIMMSNPATASVATTVKTADVAFNTLERTMGIDGKDIAKKAAMKATSRVRGRVKGGMKGGMKGTMKTRFHHIDHGHHHQQRRQTSKRQKKGETWIGPPLSPSPHAQPFYLGSSYGHHDAKTQTFPYMQPIPTSSLSSKPPSYRQHSFEAPGADGRPF